MNNVCWCWLFSDFPPHVSNISNNKIIQTLNYGIQHITAVLLLIFLLLFRNIISIHPLENPKWMTRGGTSQSRSFQLNTCQNFFLAYHLYQHIYTYIVHIYSQLIWIEHLRFAKHSPLLYGKFPHFLHTELYANFLALCSSFTIGNIVFHGESFPPMKTTSCVCWSFFSWMMSLLCSLTVLSQFGTFSFSPVYLQVKLILLGPHFFFRFLFKARNALGKS